MQETASKTEISWVMQRSPVFMLHPPPLSLSLPLPPPLPPPAWVMASSAKRQWHIPSAWRPNSEEANSRKTLADPMKPCCSYTTEKGGNNLSTRCYFYCSGIDQSISAPPDMTHSAVWDSRLHNTTIPLICLIIISTLPASGKRSRNHFIWDEDLMEITSFPRGGEC